MNMDLSQFEEIKKVEKLLGDTNVRARSLKLKEMVMDNIAQSSQSTKSFNKFVKWLKE